MKMNAVLGYQLFRQRQRDKAVGCTAYTVDGPQDPGMLVPLLSSWLEHTNPTPLDALVHETLPQIFASFLLCYTLDALVLKLKLDKSRWFTLHALVNALVVVLSAKDTWTTLADPIHSLIGPTSTLAISLVIALHIYHACYFHLTAVDIVHHVVSVGILGPLAVWFRPGVFINYVCFFVSGLPGGIDYAMLALVKHGYLDALTEKFWNCKINVWCRGPFLVVGSFIAYQSGLRASLPSGADGQCTAPSAAAFLTSAVLFWNGAFFAERVIVNYGEKNQQSTAEMYASGMVSLPRNLSKGSLSMLARNLSHDTLMRLADAN